ncbi:MAG: CotH kinase family protein, partial [Myxococcota bacterium]|nr:CotH kinase family protein [Myxococcota bacterium]
TRLTLPDHVGTPGMDNTRAVEALGPALDGLAHHPVVPGPTDPVTVTISATDPEGVASVTLWAAVDGAQFASHPMVGTGAGHYQAVLPGLPGGATVQLVVQAQDVAGAKSVFPPRAEGSRALYRVSEALGDSHGKRVIRIWMTAEDSDWFHAAPNVMSNDRVRATVVRDDREVYYDVGVRAKGSERGRVTDLRLGFGVYFNADQPFRGAYGSVMIDRSQGVHFGQREWLLNQAMARAGSVSTEYNDLVHLVAPRPAQTGSAELQLARFGNTMLGAQFDDGARGQLFEYELIYYPQTTDDGTDEGQKLPQPDHVLGAGLGAPWADKEAYRHLYLAKNNRRADDYATLMTRLAVFDLPDAEFFATVEDALDTDQWLRAFAFASLAGVTDQFASGAAHNAQFYVRPGDGRLLYFPHDLDFFFGNPTQGLVKNGHLSRLLTQPLYKRAFCGHVVDLVQTSYNADYMAHWGELMGAMLPEQAVASHLAFLAARVQHVMVDAGDAVQTLVPPVDFAITSHDGADFSVEGDAAVLEGVGWVDVHTISRVDEVSEAPLEVLWTGATTWQLVLSLAPGPNPVTLVASDRHGEGLGDSSVVITSVDGE